MVTATVLVVIFSPLFYVLMRKRSGEREGRAGTGGGIGLWLRPAVYPKLIEKLGRKEK